MAYDLMSRDTLEFCLREGVKRTTLIGHSMGGKTAMVTALSHPEAVEKLVVVDVSPCKAPGVGQVEGLLGTLQQLNISSLANRREADAMLKEDIPVRAVIRATEMRLVMEWSGLPMAVCHGIKLSICL